MAAPTFRWCLADFSASRDALDGFARDLERGPLAGRVSLLHDPRWLAALAATPDKSVRTYLLRSPGGVAGLASFLVHPSSLRLALGELTLLARPVRHLRGFAAPLVAAADADEERRALEELFRTMRADLAHDEVVFLESVVEGSALWTLLKAREGRRDAFHVLQNGRLYQHRSARLPGSFDDYLKQLGSGTRADLKRTRRKFAEAVAGGYRTRCFRTPDEVPQFVAEAISVSRKTYQYDLLGAGLRDHEPLVRQFRTTAALGWFRSYILYVGDAPVAFQVGHLYAGRYHAQTIGYDPAWARHHVGIFLHTEIVGDLAGGAAAAQWFDFGIGDTQHKQRLSTTAHAGGWFYLIPDTPSGTAFARAMRLTNAGSAAVGRVLDRMGVRERVRQLLRKAGAAR